MVSRGKRSENLASKLLFGPGERQVDAICRILEPFEVTGKQEQLFFVCAKSFINAVAEKEAVIENGNTRIVCGRDGAIDVYAGLHISGTSVARARSHSSRCLSGFLLPRGNCIRGSSPKLMFI